MIPLPAIATFTFAHEHLLVTYIVTLHSTVAVVRVVAVRYVGALPWSGTARDAERDFW